MVSVKVSKLGVIVRKFDKQRRQKGNVLFLILIAVALFAALSYAVTSSSRGGGTITKEQAQLDQAIMDNYMAAINVGRMRLEMAGCSSIDYTDPANQATSGSKACYIFHPEGGGVAWQDLGLSSCDLQGIELTDLSLGEACGNIVFAGVLGGARLYTTLSDQGSSKWVTNCAPSCFSFGATSTNDGLSNTSKILNKGGAADLCRALGAEWYLPARDELSILIQNRNQGLLNGTFSSSNYWSSTEHPTLWANAYNGGTGTFTQLVNQPDILRVRCVRR